MKIEINIDDYLSEDEKKSLAVEAFKEEILRNVSEKLRDEERLAKKDRMTDYERIDIEGV